MFARIMWKYECLGFCRLIMSPAPREVDLLFESMGFRVRV